MVLLTFLKLYLFVEGSAKRKENILRQEYKPQIAP